MSNIFKFYINNNNKLSSLYLFIKNKYLNKQLDISIENTCLFDADTTAWVRYKF